MKGVLERMVNKPAEKAISAHFNLEPVLYISCGVPGSGKTTFLNEHKRNEELIISRDDIRYSLLQEGDAYFCHEDDVFNIFVDKIIEGLKTGKNVYADATHLNRVSRSKLIRTINNRAPGLLKRVEGIFFNIPVAVCIKRNEQRKGEKTYVSESIIRSMARKLEMIDKNTEKIKHCYIIDANNNVLKSF